MPEVDLDDDQVSIGSDDIEITVIIDPTSDKHFDDAKAVAELDADSIKLQGILELEQEAAEKEKAKQEINRRSIYVGNVDYATLPVELQQHFSSAGLVNRVTILTNKFTKMPKGFAYIEFDTVDAVETAVTTLGGSMFRDRALKVSAKRLNIPGLSLRGDMGMGRGMGRRAFRGRGMGRGLFRGMGRRGLTGLRIGKFRGKSQRT